METISKKYDLLTLGELLLRLSPPSTERISKAKYFEPNIGGAEFNVAAGASQLGLKTGLIGKIPSHAIGQLARNEVHFQNVSDEYLISDNDPDARLGTYYYETAAAPRKPGIVYDRKYSSMTTISIDKFPEEMYSSTRCFHTCGITLALNEQVRKTAIEMIKRFKQAGALISFDVNFRGNLWSGEEAKACIEQILPLVDIFFCSDSTSRLTFLKSGTPEDIMESFAKEYPISVVAATQRIVHSPKKHSFGSVIYDARKKTFVKEDLYKDIEVVDRIGSGNAYISGALYGLLTSDMDTKKALQYGNAVSSLKNTVPGDLPCMNLSEIEDLIDMHRHGDHGIEMKR